MYNYIFFINGVNLLIFTSLVTSMYVQNVTSCIPRMFSFKVVDMKGCLNDSVGLESTHMCEWWYV